MIHRNPGTSPFGNHRVFASGGKRFKGLRVGKSQCTSHASGGLSGDRSGVLVGEGLVGGVT